MAGGKKSKPIVVAQIMGKWVGGGVEAVIMNYYRHIDRTKVQFDFICDEDSTNIPYEEIEKLGGHVILCPPYQKLFKYMKFLENLFREKKYRIVHSNINTLSVFPLKAAKKAGVKVRIAHSHSTSNPKEWKKNLLKNALRPFSRKYATDYFACSELAGRYLFGNKVFNAGKVKIIHNAIDAEKFKYDPEARKRLRKEIGIKEDDFVIGHIGRFVQQKNHTFLIDVFAEVKKERKNAKLVLVGQGPLEEEIKNKVNSLGLNNDVFFLGQRSDTDKLYSVFDVFCLPSLYEGLPVVGVEAQANGLACIFSNNVTTEVQKNDNVVFSDTRKTVYMSEIIAKIQRTRTSENNIQSIDVASRQLAERYEQISKTRIMHVVGSNIYSGLEKVACKIIVNLRDDYSFVYVTKPGPIEEQLKKYNIEYKLVATISRNSIKKAIRDIKPQVIHAHDYRASCMAALSTSKIPLISHLHANPDWANKKCLKTWLYRICSRRFNRVLVVSEAVKSIYACKRVDGRKMEVISNPFSSKEISAKAGNRGRKIYDICCVGRLDEPKNPFLFCDIIHELKKEFPSIRSVWVGNGSYMCSVKEIIKRKNLENNIKFVGFVDNPYVYISQSKIFMLPTKWEGFGLSVIEALSLGVPCVVSRVGGLQEVVDNSCGELCDTEDDFINACKKILINKQYCASLSCEAKKRGMMMDNEEKYINTIKCIYENSYEK